MRFQTRPIAGIFFLLLLLMWTGQAVAQVTVLVPSAPSLEKKASPQEVDMLMTLMKPLDRKSVV